MKIFILTLVFSFFTMYSSGQNAEIDSLINILKTAKEDTSKVNVLYELSKAYYGVSTNLSMDYAKQTLALSERINYKKGKGNGYHIIAVNNTMKGDYSSALEFHNKALKLRKEIGDYKGIASSYNSIGILMMDMGNYPNALKNYLSSIEIKRKIEDKKGIANTYNNIGTIYFLTGDYPEALTNHLIALKIHEEIRNNKGVADSYIHIGADNLEMNNNTEALKNYYTALKIYEEMALKSGIAESSHGIGTVYYKNSNYSEALKYHLSAYKNYKELENNIGIASSLLNIGNVYHAKFKYSDALENYYSSLKIFEDNGNKGGIASAYINIGNIYTSQKKNHRATEYLLKALSLSKEIGDLKNIILSYGGLVALDSSQGNCIQVLEHFRLYVTYKDSLFNVENTKKSVQTQMQYDFDNKEAATKAETDKKEALAKVEIGKQKIIRNSIAGGTGILVLSSLFSFLFYKRKREASFKNEVSEVEMKALRSQMNPHFIFNSLNSIDDYVHKNDLENSSLYINRFARLMRKIMENSRLEQVPLQDDLEVLELYIQMENLRMKHKVAYHITIAPEINAEQALIQPLLLQPFVENAFKHAFSGIESPTLDIAISMKNNMILCEVKDNGKGRGKQEVILDPEEKHESLGLKVTQERLNIFNKIKKTKAYIAFEDLKDANLNAIGTRVEVAVPVSYAF